MPAETFAIVGDIALRDFGLLLGALTLARLATVPRAVETR